MTPARSAFAHSAGDLVPSGRRCICAISTLRHVGGWAVDPEGLRSAASVVARAVDVTEGETTTAATAHVGDAGLASVLSTFMEAFPGGWMQRVSQTEGVAQTLTASAALYEAADDEGMQDVCQAEDF